MAARPPLAVLVAHLRRWVSDPMAQPKAFYRRHLDAVAAMSDADIAECVRWAKTTRGAEMALVHHIRQSLLEAA
jgi:hypothetical protein